MGPLDLFHAYGFDGALIDADPAIHALWGLNFGFSAFHFDRLAGAGIHTGLAAGTLFDIDFRWHSTILSDLTPSFYGFIETKSISCDPT
jgi:hypothetical protein